MMNNMTRRIVLALALVGLMGSTAACSSVDTAAPAAASVALAEGTMLIDVRTPAEFAEGHLEGAINMPVELATFPAQVAQLDPDVEYLVYCRSGRRADVALEYMATIGLSGQNLGSVDQASAATGIRVVR
jgi:phage shock protein E